MEPARASILIISNCVHKNAWAMKQLVQTRPAILFLVGQASWNMFQPILRPSDSVEDDTADVPEDGPFTLLRMTTQQECRLEFSTKIGAEEYSAFDSTGHHSAFFIQRKLRTSIPHELTGF